MSSDRRRRERAAELQAVQEAREREIARVVALTMWERIEEVTPDENLKHILHVFAIKLGLED